MIILLFLTQTPIFLNLNHKYFSLPYKTTNVQNGKLSKFRALIDCACICPFLVGRYLVITSSNVKVWIIKRKSRHIAFSECSIKLKASSIVQFISWWKGKEKQFHTTSHLKGHIHHKVFLLPSMLPFIDNRRFSPFNKD